MENKSFISQKDLQNISTQTTEFYHLVSLQILPDLKLRLDDHDENGNKIVILICDVFLKYMEKIKLYEKYVEKLDFFYKNLSFLSHQTSQTQFIIEELDKKVIFIFFYLLRKKQNLQLKIFKQKKDRKKILKIFINSKNRTSSKTNILLIFNLRHYFTKHC